MSETSKYRHLTVPYCVGNGVDIGSQGDPVVPWAVSLDLPPIEYTRYSKGTAGGNITWKGHAMSLPFKDGVCDFVYSSHLLEDFADWNPILHEWARVLKPGGYLIILVPDKTRWNYAITQGQPPNCEHRHESFVGELTSYIRPFNEFTIITDRFTNTTATDYTIIFVAQKL